VHGKTIAHKFPLLLLLPSTQSANLLVGMRDKTPVCTLCIATHALKLLLLLFLL
jgi:hypothetical protein